MTESSNDRVRSENTRSPILVPVLMAALTVVFVILVVLQLQNASDPSGEESAAVDRPSDPAETEAEAPATARSAAQVTGESDDAPAPGFDADARQLRRRLNELFRVIESFDMNSSPAEARRVHEARQELEQLLQSLGPEYAALLIEMLEEETDFVARRFLIKGLGWMGGDDAAIGLFDHYQKLTAPDAERKPHEIQYTIDSLGHVDNDLSFTLLSQLIDTEEKKIDRWRFVEALGKHSESIAAVPLFTELAAVDSSYRVRNKAGQALKYARDPGSAPRIEEILKTEKNPYVRQTLMGALSDIGDPNSLGTLERIAKTDDNHETRVSALNAIQKIGGAHAKRILEEVEATDENEQVRAYARRYVVKLEERGF